MAPRHLILVNVARHGYTLYAGGAADGLTAQPLGAESAAVPRAMLDAHRDLRAFLEGGAEVRTVLIGCDAGARPVVAYGCRFAEVADDRGRKGIVLLHAVQFDDVHLVPAYVEAALLRLGPRQMPRIAQGVARCAEHGLPEHFVALLVRKLEEHAERVGPSVPEGGPRLALAAVAHDVLGGDAIAWTTLASVAVSRTSPWRAMDIRSADGVQTCLQPSLGDTAAASEILRQSTALLLGADLDAPSAGPSGVEDFDEESPAPASPSIEPSAPAPQKSSRRLLAVVGTLTMLAIITAALLHRPTSTGSGAAPVVHGVDAGAPLQLVDAGRGQAVRAASTDALAAASESLPEDASPPSIDPPAPPSQPTRPGGGARTSGGPSWTRDHSVR